MEKALVGQRTLQFHGETFEEAKDGQRLRSLLERVRALMADGRWRTLHEISSLTGGSEASVSARLRDLRKMGLIVGRERIKGGLWKYCVGQRIPLYPV